MTTFHGPEHAARLATPSETEEAPGRVWPLWLVPGLWGAALDAALVGLCWGVSALAGVAP